MHYSYNSIHFDSPLEAMFGCCMVENSFAEPSPCPGLNLKLRAKSSRNLGWVYMLRAMIELTISLSFSLRAFTAFFLETLACCMTSSMSLASRPESSTSSPSSSSSSFFASTALPLWSWSWSWPAWSWPAAASALASCWAADACAWEFRSSILASPKMLIFI